MRRGRGARDALLKQANDTSREKKLERGGGGYKKEKDRAKYNKGNLRHRMSCDEWNGRDERKKNTEGAAFT